MAKMNTITSNIKIGTQINRWTIKSEIFNNSKHYSVNCVCECGNERTVRVQKLLTGKTRSCGCLRNEELITHGQTKRIIRDKSHEYWIWNAMIQRCTNPKNKQYPDYGARGITIDEKWLKFEGFIEDMGFRPSLLHSIDRTNNNLGYSKSNCEWKLRLHQNRNKRNNHFITANGETLCIAEWSAKLGGSNSTINQRLKQGWSEFDAVTKPVRVIRKKTIE